MTYDFRQIEKKWQKKWEEKKVFEVKEDKKKKKFCVVEMYPYPSGTGIHIGHAFNYTLGDVLARFKRMHGFNVLHPMGYDSFGLPAENAAIKAKSHPKKFTEDAMKNFAKQQKSMGLSYDWTRILWSHNPEYYKWNQWIFLKMFEKGLAYRKKAAVNWCDKCNTVLANEQVQGGKCWRHEDENVKIKHLEQWFLRITDYADEIYEDTDKLNWPERIKLMQKNWIGKSHGVEIDFEIEVPNKEISNVVIVHGSPSEDKTKNKDYIPDSKKAWIGWTKKELDKQRISCSCPQMPTPWNPKYSGWKKEFEKIKVDEDSILVGTSAGGGFLVRWLGETKTKIKKLILVSPGKVGNSDKLNEFYGDKFYIDVKDLVKEKIVIYTSKDDHDYHIAGAEEYAKAFDGKFVKFGKGYGHFTSQTLVGKDFPELLDEILSNQKYPVFTTRADTIYGVTFLVVSAQHGDLMNFVTEEQKKEVDNFLKKIKSVSEKEMESTEKEGVFTGSYAIHPLTGENIPVWIGNFVVADYGSGMVMGVPAHDQRDFEFAKKYGLGIVPVIQPESNNKEAFKVHGKAITQNGKMINSEQFDGMNSNEAKEKIIDFLVNKKVGKRVVQFKLRDWLISRQRFWGTPIPIVYCNDCGIQAVKEKDLPVVLPENIKFKSEKNPLVGYKPFEETKCPKCNGKGRRETDTMDTFYDSSWYFLRYCDSKNKNKIFDKGKTDYWMPVDFYTGGAEHACLHLIYARFFTKFFRDNGLIDKKTGEPFMKLFNQGMVHAEDGRKMSKSLGNVVDPSDMVEKYGADTLRIFLVSVASPDSDFSWDSRGMEGMHKFVKKVYDYFDKFKAGKTSPILESRINKTILEFTEDIENLKYNLAIIKLRKLFEEIQEEKISRKDAESFVKMVSLFCPHIGEEIWNKLGNKNLIAKEKWPVADKEKINEEYERFYKNLDKLVEDIINVTKILAEKSKKKISKVFVYVLPNEKEVFENSLKEISKRTGFEIKIYGVSDKDKYDPEEKSKKVKPGRPGIFLE